MLKLVKMIKRRDPAKEQEARISQMNAIADRAVTEVLRTLTAEIGTVELKKIIKNAEKGGDRYTTLAKLWFKHQQRNYPSWRKK